MDHAQTLLLVSPTFHGYWRAIEAALTAQGLRVRTHRYDERRTLASRLSRKLRHELPDRLKGSGTGAATLAAETTYEAVRAVREARPDIVLVVKGDTLGPEFWEEVDASGARTVSWFYDELRRMTFGDAGSPDLVYRRAIATYSALDATALQSRLGTDVPVIHLPLAFDTTTAFTPVRSPKVTFIGARYGSREGLLTALVDAGVPVGAYGRDWSHHPVDLLRTWSVTRPRVPAGRDVDRSHAYGIMSGSLATINAHGDQDGFTMRTFEASGVGGLQLIDRADVSDLYEPGTEVLVFRSTEELVDLARRAAREPAWAQSVRDAGRRRTLAEHTFDQRVAALTELWR